MNRFRPLNRADRQLVPRGLVMKPRVLSRVGPDLECRDPSRRKGGASLPHFSALLSSDEGVGAGILEEVCPGLDKAPSQAAWHFKGEGPPAHCLWGSRQALTNPLQFAPTNPARSLGSRKPFFTQSCSQLCLRETDLAGCP